MLYLKIKKRGVGYVLSTLVLSYVVCSSAFAMDKMEITSRLNYQIANAGVSAPVQAILSVRDFGALGDGRNDDTDAIQKAIQSMSPNSVLDFPAGTYLVSRTILVNHSHITLRGIGSTIIFNPTKNDGLKVQSLKNGSLFNTNAEQSVFFLQGSINPISLTVNAVSGGNKLLLTSAEGLRKDDLVLLACQDYGESFTRQKSVLRYYREQNFLSLISELNNNTVSLKDKLLLPFSPENNPRLYRIQPLANVTIEGFILKPAKTGLEYSGIITNWVLNIRLTKLSIIGTSHAGIIVYQGYRCAILNNTINDAIHFDSGEGYGIALERSHFCLIQGNQTSNQRHGIVLDHGNSNCLVENNQVFNCTTRASIDIHGEFNYANVIRSNTIRKGKVGVIVGGGGAVHYNDGPYNCLTSNIIMDCEYGVELSSATAMVIIGKNQFMNVHKKDYNFINFDQKQVLMP